MIEEVAGSIWSIEQPKPLRSTAPFTRCYLIGDSEGGLHVVDPGWDLDSNWTLLVDAISGIGRSLSDVRTVLVTHLHLDHLGLAERLRAQSGAAVVMHRIEQLALGAPAVDGGEYLQRWGVPQEHIPQLLLAFDQWQVRSPLQADVLVEDGDRLPVPGREIIAILTPGHTGGSMCLHVPSDRVLFTGDHLLEIVNPGVGLGPPGLRNPIAQFHDSLDRVASLDDHLALPGHGDPFTGIARRSAEIGDHYRRRTTAVAALLASDATTVWEIARQLSWSVPLAGMRPTLMRSALAQTAFHVELVRVGRAS